MNHFNVINQILLVFEKCIFPQIVNSIDMDNCLKSCSPEITVSQLTTAVTNLTLPLNVLRNAINPSLIHNHIVPRHKAIELLQVMLKQTIKFISAIEEAYQNIPEFSSLRNSVSEYILKVSI